jgi:hypothetical protein
MSDQVNVGVSRQITLAAGAEVTWDISWGGAFDASRWMRISASPDNFPSSVEILREWASTDANNAVILFATYRNNGTNTVVFRPKVVVAPAAF